MSHGPQEAGAGQVPTAPLSPGGEPHKHPGLTGEGTRLSTQAERPGGTRRRNLSLAAWSSLPEGFFPVLRGLRLGQRPCRRFFRPLPLVLRISARLAFVLLSSPWSSPSEHTVQRTCGSRTPGSAPAYTGLPSGVWATPQTQQPVECQPGPKPASPSPVRTLLRAETRSRETACLSLWSPCPVHPSRSTCSQAQPRCAPPIAQCTTRAWALGCSGNRCGPHAASDTAGS